MEILKLENLVKTYGKGETKIMQWTIFHLL